MSFIILVKVFLGGGEVIIVIIIIISEIIMLNATKCVVIGPTALTQPTPFPGIYLLILSFVHVPSTPQGFSL